MPSGMTGDFDAVLQVNGGTISRLLATMHQNSVEGASGPSIPHVTNFRIGGSPEAGGPRGSVAAQVGVPRPILIDGSRDRFRAEIPFRARYRADPNSTPLADVIHGKVRAEYRLVEVDESCHGWGGIAGDYMWLRPIRNSVSFKGSVHNDNADLIAIELIDIDEVKELVTEQLAELLTGSFAPQPQPLGAMFRRFRCLAAGSGPNDSAVAFPVGLDGGTPSGSVSSIGTRFLDGRDFGVAVGADYLTARVQEGIDPIVGLQRDIFHHTDAWPAGSLQIDYHVRIGSAQAEWLGALAGQPEQGLIKVRVEGAGWATRLYKSGAFDLLGVSINDLKMSFGVEQLLVLGFDVYGERVTVSAFGPPSVAVAYGGPFASQIKGSVEGGLSTQVQASISGALAQAQQRLNLLTAPARKAGLLEQLRRLDPKADARFDEASFGDEGLVVRGTIPLSRRRKPRVEFRRNTGKDGFDAIESWIPGGQVESFEWTWHFFSDMIVGPAGPPGLAVEESDYLLRRPRSYSTKYGMVAFAKKPLPGLDGSGRVCLTIRGSRVDSVSGAVVPVESERECDQFGYQFHFPIEMAPWIPIHDPGFNPEEIEEGPFPEFGIQVTSGIDRPNFNSLILALPEWDSELISILVAGLEDCRRVGAGLMVTLLFPEGYLAGAGVESKVRKLAQELPAPLLTAENVGEGWSEAIALSDREVPAWRLLNPEGVLAWAEDGLPGQEGLAWILERRLVPSAPPLLTALNPASVIGELLPIELLFPPCPPVPLAQPGGGGSKLIFVQLGHEPSIAELSKFGHELLDNPEPGLAAAVVAGADAEEIERLADELGLEFPLFPDPDGRLLRQAGVQVSPSRLDLDEDGRLASVRMGITREEAR